MEPIVENLTRLGLTEYEAKIYVALVGLGEANVRRIHEISNVPRARVYDILNSLSKKGFINIRQGSPLMYSAVRPDSVISLLKKDLDSAANDSVKTLEALSIGAEQNYSPIWYVHSEWTILKNLELLIESVRKELVILCFNTETLHEFLGPIAAVAGRHTVNVLFPRGVATGISPIKGVSFFEAGTVKDFFGVNIFEKVFSSPINREGIDFVLECILVADDHDSMFIYSQNGKRMAVIMTLPFITSFQSQLFNQMILHASPVGTTGDHRKSGNAAMNQEEKHTHTSDENENP